jgi:serine/threonine protein kinase
VLWSSTVLYVCCPAGGGEFGEVYKAKWHGSYVAAKVLKRSDEIALGDFRTEIAILRKIHHPNCVQVRGGGGCCTHLPCSAPSMHAPTCQCLDA